MESASNFYRRMKFHKRFFAKVQLQFVVGLVTGVILFSCFQFLASEDQLSLNIVNTVPDVAVTTPIKSSGSPKIFCWVLTMKDNYDKANLVKNTWGRRCDNLLFISSKEDPDLPAVTVPVPDGREYLWGKTAASLKYIYEHHFDEADWFYKADDDTYAVMENMRYMLSPYNSSEALYMGFKFKNDHIPQGFMSGGPGYVMSKEALRRFATVGMGTESPACNTDIKGAEDFNLGACMSAVKVEAADTRDATGALRFLPWNLEKHLLHDTLFPNSFYPRDWSFYPMHPGVNSSSSQAVAFHYVKGEQLQLYEYLIYHLKVAGRDGDFEKI